MTAWTDMALAPDVPELFDQADELLGVADALLDPAEPRQCGPCCNELDCAGCQWYVGEVKEVKHD